MYNNTSNDPTWWDHNGEALMIVIALTAAGCCLIWAVHRSMRQRENDAKQRDPTNPRFFSGGSAPEGYGTDSSVPPHRQRRPATEADPNGGQDTTTRTKASATKPTVTSNYRPV